MFESLENRKLFAVTLSGGILEIVGTSGDDVIRVNQVTNASIVQLDSETTQTTVSSDKVYVRLNGQRFDFDASDVKLIKIAGGDGNDAVRVDSPDQITYFAWQNGVTGTAFVPGQTIAESVRPGYSVSLDLIPVSIDGGAGNDALTGGGGHDTLRGGDGNDAYEVRGGRVRLSLAGNDADTGVIVTGPARLFDLDGNPIDDETIERTSTLVDG